MVAYLVRQSRRRASRSAARLLGVPATIVMPSDAPLIKRQNTEASGAMLRLYDRFGESREEIGAEIAETTVLG